MRIMMGVHQFLPDFYAGTEKLTYDTAVKLLERGHQVRIFSGYAHPLKDITPPYFDQYTYRGITVDRYYYSRRDPLVSRNIIASGYNNPRVVDGFERSVTDFLPDIVHFHHLQRLTGSVVDVCREKKIPAVLTVTDYWIVCPTHQLYLPNHSLCHGPEDPPANCLKHLCMVSRSGAVRRASRLIPESALKSLMRRLSRYQGMTTSKPITLVKALMRRNGFLKERLDYIGKILVATYFMKSILTEWGIPGAKIVHLPFSVAGGDHEGGPKKRPGNVLRIGFIGTLNDYKGAHILLEAIRKIPRETSLAVKVYGDLGQYPAYLEQLKKTAGSDQRVDFCGTFEPERIGKVLQNLDLLAVPSLWHENTPLVIHAAIGYGVPVLGSNVGGINELIQHEINGMLFERGNAEALSNIVRRLSDDRRLLEKLAAGCKALSSMDGYVDRLEKIYASMCSKGRGKLS